MKLAIVGIQGLPNNYGGFETLAEFLVEYLSADFDITVYCSSKDLQVRMPEYKGAKLRYIRVSSHGAFGMLYDSMSLLDAISKFDKILLLGFGAGFTMPFLKRFRDKIILNFGGLDWQRNKWSKFTQQIIRRSEGLLVRNSGQVISDNIGIQEYIDATYKKNSTLIAYGGDQAKKEAISVETSDTYKDFINEPFAFSVARIQPDNNIEMILESFRMQNRLPLVMVGNWNSSAYGKEMKLKYTDIRNLILLDAIYDTKKLNELRSNCLIYVHGHSAGGTNPSLVEAMNIGLPVFSFASGYNESTTGNQAVYFRNSKELTWLIEGFELSDLQIQAKKLKAIAERDYKWKIITGQYKQVIMHS